MFESNFPADKESCSYAILWNAFKRLAAGYSATEKQALFSGTAARAYGSDDESRWRIVKGLALVPLPCWRHQRTCTSNRSGAAFNLSPRGR